MNITDSLSHHATLFIHNDRKVYTEKIWEELASNSIAHILHDQTVIDIDTARKLISWANTPYEGKKTALVSFHTITIPAQNALLKIVEEPRSGVRFIFVTTNKDAIIPTLYSRLQEKSIEMDFIEKNDNAEIFLTTPNTQRIKLPCIVQLLTKVDEEGRKDREAVRTFILSLIPLLTKNNVSPKYITETLEASSYASDPSSSGKALLEYLSLLLPQTKD
jgi:hypothetical protein